MKKYLEGFRDYLLNTKKSAANTIEAYIRDIEKFNEYLKMNGTSKFSDINDIYIKKYLEYLSFLGKSESTKTRVIASIRGYFKYLISIDAVKSNPLSSIKTTKAKQKLPKILDSSEIIHLISQPSGNDYKSVRDRAMLELLYATGIKVSEIISLKISDINLQLGILHIGSNNTDNLRIIPIYPAAVKHLNDYITNVRPVLINGNNNDILFTNMNGAPMSRQGFWKIIKYYAIKAGIDDKDITPHTLRHSFAAHLLENGAQLKDIKDMLGHSDLSSTKVYAQLIKNKYTQSYAKFHPLAK